MAQSCCARLSALATVRIRTISTMGTTMGASEAGVITTGLQDEVVLALSRKGRDELRHPRAGLALPQRKLLTLIDGKRSLREIATAEPTLHADRVHHDAARLLGRGLVEIEKGWLQPITRPTTVSPGAAPARPTDAAARPRAERAAPRRPPAKTAPARRRSSGALWFGLVAVGLAGIAIGYSLQPPAARPTAAATAPSSLTKPPVPSADPTGSATTLRPTEPGPMSTKAQAAAAAVGEHAAAPAVTGATPRTAAVPPPRAAATATAAVKIAPQSLADAVERSGAFDAPAPTPKSTERPAPRESAPASTVAAQPAIADAPTMASASSPSDIPPATAPVATAAAAAVPPPAAAPAEVPAWAREFAPLAPEADNARMMAVGSGVTPIERVPPIYPRDAVRQGITSGSIRARAIIGANGSVERVEFPAVDSRNRVFERPARAALLTWTFPPGERGRVYEVVLNFVAP
jgi:hypothetical protein